MLLIEPPLNPPCNIREEYEKPAFILGVVQEICESIAKKGERSPFNDILDLLYEYVENNLEKFLPESY